MKFKNFDKKEFLKHDWNKKPSYFKSVAPAWENLVDENDLAGLSMDEEVISQFVKVENETYRYQSGPFLENDFENFGEDSYSLMVRHVDKYNEELAHYRDLFSFLPRWKFDDIMMTYSTDKGSSGPHIDNYDVFILQLSGTKKWLVEKNKREKNRKTSKFLIDNLDYKILNSFDDHYEYELNEGDLLYIPSGFAHQGIAKGKSLSMSFGFREPELAPVLTEALNHYIKAMEEELFIHLEDHEEEPNRLKDEFWKELDSWPSFLKKPDVDMVKWFGKFITYSEDFYNLGEEHIPNDINQTSLEFLGDQKFCYYINDNNIFLFVGGHLLEIPKEYHSALKNLSLSQFSTFLELLPNDENVNNVLGLLVKNDILRLPSNS